MERLRGVRAPRGEVKALNHAQHLDHTDAAGGGRPHAAHLVCAIGRAQRCALDGAMGGKIGGGDVAGILRSGSDGAHDVVGDLAGIERIRTLGGDGAQDLREGRIDDARTDRLGFAVGVVEERLGGFDGAQRPIPGEQLVQSRRHGEAIFGDTDSRIEQLCPRQLAAALMRHLEHAQHTGHAHRAPADNGGHAVHGLAVGRHKAIGLRRRRRGLAAVEGGERFCLGIPQHHEGAAAEARRLGLHHVENELGGDGRVHRGAAGGEDVRAGLGGDGISGHDHVVLGGAALLARAAGGRFRRREVLTQRRQGEQKRKQNGGKAAHGEYLIVGQAGIT